MTYSVCVCFTNNYQHVPFVYYNLIAKMDTVHQSQCVEHTFLNVIMTEVLDRSETHFILHALFLKVLQFSGD